MPTTKQLVVTAPLVIAKNDAGADVYLYEGATVPDGQSKEWLKRHRRDKMIGEREVRTRAPATDDASEVDEAIAAFLDRDARDVIADVESLNEEDRAAAIEAEAAGSDRVTVLRALRGESE